MPGQNVSIMVCVASALRSTPIMRPASLPNLDGSSLTRSPLRFLPVSLRLSLAPLIGTNEESGMIRLIEQPSHQMAIPSEGKVAAAPDGLALSGLPCQGPRYLSGALPRVAFAARALAGAASERSGSGSMRALSVSRGPWLYSKGGAKIPACSF